MENEVTEAGNFAGRQRKLKHEMTHHIFPPIPGCKSAGAADMLADTKHHLGGHCCRKKQISRGSVSSGTSQSGSISSYSERSYSSSYCSCSSCCSCAACCSPTHLCSYCRCRCYSSTSLPACCSNGGTAPVRTRHCTSSAPLPPMCCCSHRRMMRQGPRRAHVHIPESIAEEMEGEGEGEREGEGEEGGGAVGKHGRKRRGRKRRGNNCVNLPRINTGVRDI